MSALEGERTYSLVPFWVGVGAAPESAPEIDALYETIVELVFQVPRPRSVSSPPAVVVPAEGSERTGRVMGELYQVLEDSPQCDYLVLDRLTADARYGNDQVADLRGGVDLAIAQAISAFTARNPERVIALLVESIPPTRDAFWEALADAVEAGSLVVVDGRGRVSPGRKDPDALQIAVRERVAQLRGTPLQRLENGIVRRWGWFPRRSAAGDDVERYVQYYYDAGPAEGALTELLERYLAAREVDGVVYHWEASRWLAQSVESAAASRSLDVASVDEVVGGAARWLSGEDNRLVLVLPMVETGRTLRRTLKRLEELRDISVDSIVSIMFDKSAVLSTSSDFGWDCHVVVDGTERLDLFAFVPVEQRAIPESDLFLMQAKRTGVATAPNDDQVRGPFSPLEYWSMVAAVGLQEESNPPSHRPTEARVPKTSQLLADFGPWIARRLWSIVETEVRTLATDTVFVCPGGEAVSALLADQLRRTVGVRVIEVPRSDLTALSLGNAVEGDPSWMGSLRSASSARAVMLLDDFTRSGTTFEHLQLAVDQAELPQRPLATCLFDFRPSAMRDQLRILALYSTPLDAATALT